MFASTDEEFMKNLEVDFPNEDWDNVPDLSTYPDVYELQGVWWMTYYDVYPEGDEAAHIQTQATSPEDAIAYIQNHIDLGIRPELEGKKLMAKITVHPRGHLATPQQVHFCVSEMPTLEEANKTLEEYKSKSYVLLESLKIVTKKPEEAYMKEFCKEFRQRILNGEKVFPMYLP